MPTPTPVRINPYVGPRSFQSGEHLYGRDRELRDLMGLLIAERIVLLHSPSGAGKTSLIQAALIPELTNSDFVVLPTLRVSLEPPSGDEWGLTAQEAPNRFILSLLLSLEEGVPADQQMSPAELAALSFDDYLKRRIERMENRPDIVLIFDQFEEILTIDPVNQAAKHAFFAQLGAALRNRQIWALFVMRDDYVAGLTPYVRPVPTRFNTTFRLDLLGVAAARAAIQQPAHAHGVEFDQAAATRLIDDLRRTQVQLADGRVETQPGPYVEPVQLQVVCYRLWEGLADDDVEIAVADIEAVGDVDQALAAYYAERVWKVTHQTNVSERAIREWFDRQLITAHGIRGQVLQSENASQGLVNAAIFPLIDAYLVRAEKRRGMTWFELAHDRLIAPVRTNNATWFMGNLSELQRRADLWEQQGRPDGLLLRDDDLTAAEEWAAANEAILTEIERVFLERCRDMRTIVERSRRQARRIRVLAIGASILSVLAVIALIGALIGFSQADQQKQIAQQERDTARQQTKIADARGFAAAAITQLDGDPELSLILARAAVKATDPELEAESAAIEALNRAFQESRVRETFVHPDTMYAVAYSPDDRWLVSAGFEGVVYLHNIESGETRELEGHTDLVFRLAFSPDGRLLATAGYDGAARVWEAESGEALHVLEHPDNTPVTAIAFSADGRRLATGDAYGVPRVWNLGAEQFRDLPPHNDSVNGVAFSPDGRLLATAGADSRVRLYDLDAYTVAEEIDHNARLFGLAFSPDGDLIALADSANLVLVWELTTDKPLRALRGHGSVVQDIAFDRGGNLLATASDDGTARIWDVNSDTEIAQLTGHQGGVWGVDFSRDASRVVTAGSDGTVRIWDATRAYPSEGSALAFSPNGEFVAVGDRGGRVRMVEVASGKVIWSEQAGGRIESGLAFSPDGSLVAAGGDNGEVTIWYSETGESVETLKAHIRREGDEERPSRIFDLAFNSDGTTLATLGGDFTVRLWDISAYDEPVAVFESENQLSSLAFAPSGDRIALIDVAEGQVILWDYETDQTQTIAEISDIVRIAYSPDGAMLAVAGFDGNIFLIDAETGDDLGDPLNHGSIISDIAFNQDGSLLASAGSDSMVKIWDVAAADIDLRLTHPAQVSALAFSPDGGFLVTFGADGVIRNFPLDLDTLLALAAQHITRDITADECEQLYLEDSDLCADVIGSEEE